MIPGVMTGFQIGEVMRASGSLRRVVAAGDAGFAAAAAAATGQRGRKGSLSEVVLGLVRGKSVTGRPSQSRGSTSGRGVPTGRGEMEEEQHLMERDEDAADREEAVVLEEEEEEGRGNEGNTATGVSVLLPALATDQDLESEWARREDEATRMNDRDRER